MQAATEATKNWIENFVLKYQLCPFAHQVFEHNQIFYSAVSYSNLLQLSLDFDKVISTLESGANNYSTAFIILKNGLENFDDYLDVYYILEEYLADKHEGAYQLVSFHPNYIFEKTSTEDKTNYTNRSPYPCFHFLNTEEVHLALQSFGDPKKIIEQNNQTLTKFSLEKLTNITRLR